MNQFAQLRIHVLALNAAILQNTKFFASIILYVERFRILVDVVPPDISQSELALLAAKIEEFYRQWRPSGSVLYIPPRETSDTDSTVRDINKLVDALTRMSEEEFRNLLPVASSVSNPEKAKVTNSPCVFVGHGRSKLWARVQIYLQNELGIATVTYESESRTGEAIVPVLEKMLDQATFAILVLTAEDDTADGTQRARQNVVHEAGLFQGHLGFKKAILLVQEGIEEFSNVAGLQHIPFSRDNIEHAFYELQRVLKREGQIA